MRDTATTKTSHKAPLSEQAYYLIRERILSGALPPGAVFSRRRLAKEFNMSFVPISEAVQRLASDGLVESRPRVGTRVRMPSPDEVRGQFVVREALEAQSAILCCERAAFAERLELRSAAEQLDALYERGAHVNRKFLYAVHMNHVQLHMRIAEYGHCPELKEAIERDQILIHNWFYDVLAGKIPPPHFHAKLVEFITGKDVRAAEGAMREHVRYGLPGVLDSMGSQFAQDWRLKRECSPT